jgi:hypothetical protein
LIRHVIDLTGPLEFCIYLQAKKPRPKDGALRVPSKGVVGALFPRPNGSVFELLLFGVFLALLLIPHLASDHLGIQPNGVDAIAGRPKVIAPVTLLT